MDKCLYPRKNEPHKVFFTWQITYDCNYNCAYCHSPKHGQRNVVDTEYLSTDEWIKRWNEVYDMYGECEINISGGEPTIYPHFFDIVQGITKKHKVEIVTNLSFDIDKFIYNLNPERVRFAASFHPEFVSIDDFINKVKKISGMNFIIITNFVPWLPFFDKIDIYRKKFFDNNIKVVLQPFIGMYNGKEYPKSYNDEEKRILQLFTKNGNEYILDFKLGENK